MKANIKSKFKKSYFKYSGMSGIRFHILPEFIYLTDNFENQRIHELQINFLVFEFRVTLKGKHKKIVK